MTEINLRYGGTNIALRESATLIGVRPRRNGLLDARAAFRRGLDGASFREEGTIGGFHVVSVEPAAVDAGKALDRIRRDSAVSVGTHVFELPDGRGIYVPTGDVYVEFDPGLSDEVRQKLVDRYALTVKEARGPDGLVLSVTPDSPNPVKVAAGLQQEHGVAIAEPDLASRAAVKASAVLADALLPEQWHLRNLGFHRNTNVGFVKGADARVLDAWSAANTRGSPAIVIAVIDDGFDLAHPDFARPGKIVHPWDFSRQSPDPRPGSGDWHGTACAGVATGLMGGGAIVGAAPDCTLMPVRWGPDLSDAQVESWFDYVASRGAHVVSCSWGAENAWFPLSTRAYRAIEKCARQGRGGKGCVIVFAAGNANRDIYDPDGGSIDGFANHPDVIAVAASNSRDMRSNYSNFGDAISVCAPSSGAGGWGILTADVTDPANGGQLGYATGDYTYDFGGTSSACPLVAGIAGLLLSIKPDLTASGVKALLERTARRLGDPASYDARGHSRHFGHGCVNALAAVQALGRHN
ncbi:MAG TPA: S8 family serine peptidase [Allosphingosinicella sp.]